MIIAWKTTGSWLPGNCIIVINDYCQHIEAETKWPPFRGRRFQMHFLDQKKNVWISLMISLKFVPNVPIKNCPALVQIMAWRRSGDKPLSEPIVVRILTHICDTRSQWFKSDYHERIHNHYSKELEIINRMIHKQNDPCTSRISHGWHFFHYSNVKLISTRKPNFHVVSGGLPSKEPIMSNAILYQDAIRPSALKIHVGQRGVGYSGLVVCYRMKRPINHYIKYLISYLQINMPKWWSKDLCDMVMRQKCPLLLSG